MKFYTGVNAESSVNPSGGTIKQTTLFSFKPKVDGKFSGITSLAEMPNVAEQIIPIKLEEWMHQLQYGLGRPISSYTGRYLEYKGTTQWFQRPGSKYLDHDVAEIDILAAFREWGMPVEKLGTVSNHPDQREPFDEWFKTLPKSTEASQ
jgi:hypothetical protein